MKKLELKYRKLLRKIFGCVSFTAMAFVFQACYGSREASTYDVKLTGMVRSETTHLPIKGIKIIVNESSWSNDYGFTDENGQFDFYASVPLEYNGFYYYYSEDGIHYTHDSVYVQFIDIDGAKNGHFADKTLIINPASKDEVKLFVELKDKQE